MKLLLLQKTHHSTTGTVVAHAVVVHGPRLSARAPPSVGVPLCSVVRLLSPYRSVFGDERDLQAKLERERHRCEALTMELEKRTQQSNDLQRQLEKRQMVQLTPSPAPSKVCCAGCHSGGSFMLSQTQFSPTHAQGSLQVKALHAALPIATASPVLLGSEHPVTSIAKTVPTMTAGSLVTTGGVATTPLLSVHHHPSQIVQLGSPLHQQQAVMSPSSAVSVCTSRTSSTSPVRVKVCSPQQLRPVRAALRQRSQPARRLSVASPRSDLGSARTARSTIASGAAVHSSGSLGGQEIGTLATLQAPICSQGLKPSILPVPQTPMSQVATSWPAALVGEKSPSRASPGADSTIMLRGHSELQRRPSTAVL